MSRERFPIINPGSPKRAAEFCQKFRKKFRHFGESKRKKRNGIKSYYTRIFSFRLANFPSIIHSSPLYLLLSRRKEKRGEIEGNKNHRNLVKFIVALPTILLRFPPPPLQTLSFFTFFRIYLINRSIEERSGNETLVRASSSNFRSCELLLLEESIDRGGGGW